MKKTIAKNKVVILTAIFFIFSLLIGKSFDLLTIKQFSIGLGLFILLTLSVTLLLKLEIEGGYTQYLENLTSKLERVVISSKPDKYPFILEDIELLEIERNQNCEEIWIISNDLENDHEKSFFLPAIQENIAKGIVYKYLVPNTEAISGKVISLKKVFRSKEKQLEVYQIPHSEIKAITYTDIAFYNPTGMPKSEPENVFARLPIEEFNYWIKFRVDLEWEIKGKINKHFKREENKLPSNNIL